MTQRIASLVLAVWLLSPGIARGQSAAAGAKPDSDDDHVTRQIIPFLEGSYLYKSNEPHVIFAAAIYPHLVLWQNFDNLIDARRSKHVNESPSWWRQYWAVSLTPGVRLKMSDAFSEPVRTPSYLPRADIQKMVALGRAAAVSSLEARRKTTLDLLEVHVAIEHHSNGQDGCLFLDQEVQGADQATAKCVPDYSQRSQPGVVNKHDGNFSTNEVRIGVNLRRTDVATSGAGTRHYGAGLEYQRQFATDPDLKPFYSQNRLNASASIAWAGLRPCSSRIEAVFQAITALDHPVPSVSKTSASVQLSCFPSIKGGFGAFVKGYWGQDPYNLGFLDNITRVQFGLTFNQDGIFKFRAAK
jgi:hypothetical protein